MMHLIAIWTSAHDVHVGCFQETRWRGTVCFPLRRGFWFANTGGGGSTDGVAMVLSPKALKALDSIEYISGCHIVATLRTHAGPSAVHNVHAPSNDSSNDKKNKAWHQLLSELQETPKPLPVFVCGDLQRQVGSSVGSREKPVRGTSCREWTGLPRLKIIFG